MDTPHGARPHADGTTTFHLWAPAASEVTLHVEGRELPMAQRSAGQWWARTWAGHGDRYAYALDGGEPLPDPASAWLPEGVHAPSAVVDPARLPGRDPAFVGQALSAGAVYELHVGTFTLEGTLFSAIDELDALVELGVTHVELMPVNGFDGRWNWGYDGVAWWAVHEAYGGPDGLAAFIRACHARRLAVVLDVVFNHLGPSGNYLPRFGPYLRADAESTWGKVINLDGPDSQGVRDFILGCALWWLRDYGLDGLRLDAIHAFDDRGSAVPLLAELADAATELEEKTGRRIDLIAETDRNDPQTIRPRAVGGLGLDAQWADDLHHAIHVALTGELDGYYVDFDRPLERIAQAWTGGFVYDGRHSAYRGRTVGAPIPPDVSSRRLVACIQNHDQVGNRAAGDRLTALVDPRLVDVGVVLLCTAPHTPMLFMGEEYGEARPFQFFSDMPGDDLRTAIRDGRRREFAAFTSWQGEVPDPLDPATFERSKLDRGKADPVVAEARRRLWQDLLSLRRSEPALGTGRRDLVSVVHAGDDVLALRRDPPAYSPGAGAVLVVANLGGPPVPLEHLAPGGGAAWELLLATDPAAVADDEAFVAPRSAAVYLARLERPETR